MTKRKTVKKVAKRIRTKRAQGEEGTIRQMRAIALIGNRPMTRASLATALGIPDRTTNDLLHELQRLFPLYSTRAGVTILYSIVDSQLIAVAKAMVARVDQSAAEIQKLKEG